MNLPSHLAILNTAQVITSEKEAISLGTPVSTLMERAGQGVYETVASQFQPQPTLVICGPGNNGGDGYVVARLLAEAGWPVKVIGVKQKNPLPSVDKWKGETLELSPENIQQGLLFIDALFGTGLERTIEGQFADIIQRINKVAGHVVSIDIPSGIHTNQAEILGVAVKADTTVTFNFKKPAHVLLPGRDYCGKVIVHDIGLKLPSGEKHKVYCNHPQLWKQLYPLPTSSTHKYKRGFVHIYGGDEMTGAARLAASATRRMGAGMVLIASLEKAHEIYESECIGVLTKVILTPDDFTNDERTTCALIGPGSGRTQFTKDLILSWLVKKKPSLLDADALYVFKDDPAELYSALKAETVLTPHEGEFSRLFPISGDKITRTQNAAKISGATVLLKGSDTVIAEPKGYTVIQDWSSPYLATGGTGDILSGMISALLSQGLTGLAAASCATWVHASAAEKKGIGLIAEDMPDLIPDVLKDLLEND